MRNCGMAADGNSNTHASAFCCCVYEGRGREHGKRRGEPGPGGHCLPTRSAAAAKAAAGATAKVNDDCKDGAWPDQLLLMPA